MKLRFEDLLYDGPNRPAWVALCLSLATIGICARVGHLLQAAIVPFLFFPTVGLALYVLDATRASRRKSLKWHGLLWLMILAIASWAALAPLVVKMCSLLSGA